MKTTTVTVTDAAGDWATDDTAAVQAAIDAATAGEDTRVHAAR